MLNGEDTLEDMIASVDDGLYAVNFDGGQVDITSGKFLATCSPIFPVKTEVPLRLKSPSKPCPIASCNNTPGQPGPSVSVIVEHEGRIESASSGGGGRYDYRYFIDHNFARD
jgi:predicted Zn-dependent protease